MAINYGAEIRRLAREYTELTGENPFSGIEQRSGTIRLYLFSDGSIDNGPEALGHMRELLAAARRPDACPDHKPGKCPQACHHWRSPRHERNLAAGLREAACGNA